MSTRRLACSAPPSGCPHTTLAPQPRAKGAAQERTNHGWKCCLHGSQRLILSSDAAPGFLFRQLNSHLDEHWEILVVFVPEAQGSESSAAKGEDVATACQRKRVRSPACNLKAQGRRRASWRVPCTQHGSVAMQSTIADGDIVAESTTVAACQDASCALPSLACVKNTSRVPLMTRGVG